MKKEKLMFCIFSENRSMAAAMIAALTQDYGWDVDIEFIAPQTDLSSIQERITVAKPDLLALSFRSYERQQAFEVASLVKDMGVKTIAGGTHPTMLPEDVIQCGFFDAIVQGDAMGVLDQILDGYKNFENSKLIKGQRHHDKKVYLRQAFSDSQKSLMRSTHTVNMLTSIGCPFSCKYCGSSRLDYFMFPEQELVNNMVELATNYDVKIFTFHDDLLCANVRRLQRISSLLEEKLPDQEVGFGRSINARASNFNEDLAAELVRLKITDVSFGIESASTKLLKFLKKKQTQEHCYKAIELCHKFGLYSRVNLMFGIPTQDQDDYEFSLQFIKDTQPDVANLFYFTPYPGTDLYDYCFDNNYFPNSYDRNRFDWFKPNIDGIRNIQCRLNKVDYDMANYYMNQISNIYDSGDCLQPLLNEFDQYPWVLIGSSVQIYFSQILKKLKKYRLKNFLGYFDIAPGAAYSVANRVDDHEYYPDSDKPPVCFVTYCHTTGRDFQNFQSVIKEKFGNNVPLISISSMKRHTAEEIRHMIHFSRAKIGSQM